MSGSNARPSSRRRRYVGIRVTPGRIVAISAFDGDEQPIAVGPLADAMVLHADRIVTNLRAPCGRR
ncbi:MAG: hypothetical protein ACRDZZ_09225 [Ilumatobacteraceae bacterium]